ncbi:MAG TPA: PilZ domain-containing protein [Polyangia bacterium]|nr:PilZ domain-containing protein [Polyangia bacterium]
MLSTGRWRPPLGQTPLTGRRAPRLIAVGAALPGLGKSVVASNLAVAMAGLGRHVVLVDLDAAAPRQHALFGVDPPPPEGGRLTGIRHLRLAPLMDRHAGVGLDALAQIDADVVIADLGSAAPEQLWTSFATAERLVVTTGEPAALQATYGFLHQAAARAERQYGADARAVLARFMGGLIGNAATAPEDAERFHAFTRMVREQLGIPLISLGCLRKTGRIAQSVMMGRPLVARRGIDDDVRLFHNLAELLAVESGAQNTCALDGAPGEPLAPPAPIDLGRYQRKHPRFVVDWAATLATVEGPNAVRVRDVSESGVAVETTLKLGVGDRCSLCFYQLPGQPSVEVVVRNVVPGLNRLGLAFVDDPTGDTPAELARIARERSTAEP